MGLKHQSSIQNLLTIILLVLTCGCYAQLPDYHLQLFDHNAGVRPGNIVQVAKDKKGFLWILYARQVQRFDGKQVKTFRPPGNLYHLYCDSVGRVWVGTRSELLLYDEESMQFRPVPFIGRDSALIIGKIFNLADKRTFVITNRSFYEYDVAGGNMRPALQNLPVPPTYSVRVFASHGHSLFLNHDGYIYRFNSRTNQLDSLLDKDGAGYFPVSEDSMFVSTWNNVTYLYDFAAHSMKILHPAEVTPLTGVGFFSIRSIVQFEQNKFFVASREGIYQYDQLNKNFTKLRFFFNGRRVATNDYSNFIHLDEEGSAWLATVDGVARFSVKNPLIGLVRIRQLQNDLPVAIDNVRRMLEDEQGNLWLATGNGFVSWKRSENQWKIYLPVQGSTNKLNHPSIRGLAYDGRYVILGPTDNGVWLFNPRTEQYVRPTYQSREAQQLSMQDFIDDIFSLSSGDYLIMGRDAIYVLEGKNYRIRLLEVPAGKENSNYAFQGKDGIVWITTNDGLHCLDSNLNYLQKVKLPFADNFISCGYVMNDNRLLFSATGGLYTAFYSNGSVTVKRFTDQLNNIFFTTLYQDSNHVIWASSENGLYRYDPAKKTIHLFDNSDNIQGYGFNGNSWVRTQDGYLFLGGVNGMNYFNPENFKLPDEQLKVYISRARSGLYDSLNYTLSKPAELSYSDRSLALEFISPYFNNYEKVQYRYRIQGLDDEWKYLGSSHHVRISSIPPGNYTVQLEGTINNIDWVRASNTFSFTVKSPFWLRWWFIVMALVFVSLVLGLILRNRNQKIQEKQEELEAEQAVNYFASSMYEHHSVDSILWDVSKNCIGRLQFEDCVIYLLDKERQVLMQKAAHGPKSPRQFEIAQPIEIPIGRGIVGSVALSGVAEIIPDTSRDPRYIVDDQVRYSEITVPIISNGVVEGVIDCEHSKKGFFTQKHLSILTTIASLCANKIVKVRAEAEKMEAERVLMDTKQRMSEVEMQALRAQMNPHFIFNCLNSINRYIVKSDQATASLFLTRFAKLIRLILDNSNSKSVTLSNDLEALRLYIEMESIRFEKQFTYKITIDENVHPDTVYVPPLIIQPYVENAIWHGLLHKETAGHLTIRVSRKSNTILECIIEDNGVGRDKARDLKSKSASAKKSLGMKLTEDRLALLNKQADLDSSVQVEDLRTNAGDAAGTKVILKISIDG